MGRRRSKWLERIVIFAAGVFLGAYLRVPLWTAPPFREESRPDPKLYVDFEWARGQVPLGTLGWNPGLKLDDDGLVYVAGHVENISEVTLEGLTVTVHFWSAADHIVEDVEVPVSEPSRPDRPLGPGEHAIWRLTAPWKGAMTEGGISVFFQDGAGASVEYLMRTE